MRHWSDAKQSTTPFTEWPYIKLEQNELSSCCFSFNGRYSAKDDQGVGGFAIRIGQGNSSNPTLSGKIYQKKLTSGPIGTCYAMTFHVSGFVKDGYIHTGILYEAANRESSVANPHEVYEIDTKDAILPDAEFIFIAVPGRLYMPMMDYAISGDIYS